MIDLGLDAQWILPRNGAGSTLRDLVVEAADAGIDHLGVGDHVSFRDGTGFDGLINAALLLASDPRIAVHVGVYLLALRHPVLVARQLASIAEQAPGRLTLACGVGGEDRNEFSMCGVDPATRGAQTDESLDVLRALLAGGPVDHEGRFFDFQQAHVAPAPDPTPRLLIGGRSEAALRRTARRGDGWHGLWISADRFGRSLEQIAEVAAEVGRTDAPTDHAMTFWCGFDGGGKRGDDKVRGVMEGFYKMPFDRFAAWCPTGSPEDVAAFIEPFVEHGCRSATLVAAGSEPQEAVEKVAEVRRLLA